MPTVNTNIGKNCNNKYGGILANSNLNLGKQPTVETSFIPISHTLGNIQLNRSILITFFRLGIVVLFSANIIAFVLRHIYFYNILRVSLFSC
jgi:hypothetical protein